MPIPQTIQINPLDLQGNIAIGVSLPFNGPVAFNSTYSTADQLRSNLINLLLTNKGERIMNPEFGCDLRTVLFDGIDDEIVINIKNLINYNVNIFVPQVTVSNINVVKHEDNNSISVSVSYIINLSGTADQITVQFV